MERQVREEKSYCYQITELQRVVIVSTRTKGRWTNLLDSSLTATRNKAHFLIGQFSLVNPPNDVIGETRDLFLPLPLIWICLLG